MQKRFSRQKFTQMGVALGIIIAVVGLFFFAVRILENRLWPSREAVDVRHASDNTSSASGRVLIGDTWYTKKERLSTVLLIGSDDYQNADFLMLLVKEEETGRFTGIQINRDTMTVIPGSGSRRTEPAQIGLSMKYGDTVETSCRNVKDSVSYLLYDIDIDNYIAIDMSAVPILNAAVDGVIIDEKKLEDEESLAYVRGRKGVDDESNIARMERQKEYMQCWFEQAQDTLGSPEKTAKVISDLGDSMNTDLTASQFVEFGEHIRDYSTAEIISPEGTNDISGEHAEFTVDDDKLQELVLDIFYNKEDET